MLGETVRTVLGRVMSNDEAKLYSWKGGKGKLKRLETKFKSVLFRKYLSKYEMMFQLASVVQLKL